MTKCLYLKFGFEWFTTQNQEVMEAVLGTVAPMPHNWRAAENKTVPNALNLPLIDVSSN
jgi:hypothetical protein